MEEIVIVLQELNGLIQDINKFDFWDGIALMLSLIAIVISVWAVKKSNNQGYKNALYEDVLKDKLHKELPKLINQGIDNNNKIVNAEKIEELEHLIQEIRSDIIVFKYIYSKFYEKIDKLLIQIDEIIVTMNSRSQYFDRKYEELMKVIKKLYDSIENKFFK